MSSMIVAWTVVKLKKFALPMLALLLFALCAPPAAEAKDLGMNAAAFFKNMGYAAARVRYGVSPTEIEKGKKSTGTGFVVDCDESVMLIVNVNSGGSVKNVAVAYAAGDEEEQPRYSRGGSLSGETMFENICSQLMFALHSQMTRQTAKATLKKLGLDGKLLDGIQRSSRIEDCVYLMKMQPNGMVLMVVSHI
jgi:hypothetical protein